MSPQWFRFAVVTLIKLVLVFGRHKVGADFSDNCDNSPNSHSCIHTYEELYNSLAKSENSFNIESAIYPSRRPSSVRVFVNLHGPNETENLIVPYTWSLFCLYVAVPPLMLEVLSLGSILVTPRTQTLNITIPYFCCNVSKKEDERRTIIKERIKRALASLQDLAVSPEKRDPRMNTAECVIEGHGIDSRATGRSVYIKTIHWCSFLFAVVVSYMLTSFLQHCRKVGWPGGQDKQDRQDRQKIRIENTAKAIFYLGLLLSILGLSQQLVLLFLFANFHKDVFLYTDIAPSILTLWFTVVFNIVIGLPPIRDKLRNYFPWSADEGGGMSFFSKPVTLACATNICFCSCWMLIGIMLNPTWGLTVTLIICFTFASFAYAVHEYLTLVNCIQGGVKKLDALLPGVLGFLAVIVLIPVIVFAGQSFNGRETADETLKTILVTALGSFISWLSWKRLLEKRQKSEETQTPRNDTEMQNLNLLA